MKGAVLAAGLGTRLRPLTTRRPKPLVPVAGRPLIEYALDALAGAGITQIGINAFHLGAQVEPALAHRPEQLTVVHETELRGTGGGIRGIARALGGGPLAVVNGDALFDFDLAPLLAQHRTSGALATLVLRHVPPDAPFGRVGVDAGGRLHRIAEVEGPEADAHPLRYGAFTGVQFIEQPVLDAIPEGAYDILRSAYRHHLDRRALLRGVFVDADRLWLDVGNVERYLTANRAALRGQLPGENPARISLHADIAEGALIDRENCRVEADVVVGAGARIGPDVVLGRGAVVRPGAVVRNAVVWPGAVVDGLVSDEVVLPDQDS